MINTELSNTEYHAESEHFSSSDLKLYLKDPIAFHKQKILGEREPIPAGLQAAFDLGTYFHTLVLEPHLVDEEILVVEDSQTLKLKKQIEKPHMTVITESQKSVGDKMYKAFDKATFYPEGKKIKTFFQRGQAEESFFGEIDGLKVKARTDYRKSTRKGSSINDVKTTSKLINSKNIKKVCRELDYDLSAALYIDLVEKLTGKKHDFYFLFVGKKDFKCRIFRASPEFIERGRKKYKKAIEGIKKSLETGVWIAEV